MKSIIVSINCDSGATNQYQSVEIRLHDESRHVFNSGDPVLDFLDALQLVPDSVDVPVLYSSSVEDFLSKSPQYIPVYPDEASEFYLIGTRELKTLPDFLEYYRSRRSVTPQPETKE